MGAIPAFLLRHQVTIEVLEGEGPFGPLYGPPVEARAFVDQRRRLVRSASGSEVVSETTVYLPPGTVCPPGSRVTLPSGAVSTVITTSVRDGGGLPTPDHVEAALT